MLTLAKRLNMLTVAEGVETPEQARWLSERGVNFMQGYWISRPLPLDDFVRWLKKPYTPQLYYLKIDRGFINAIGTETITSPVLDAVLTLAKRLNMLTVAEGVETPVQARWLSERGVNFMQGFWFSRPLPLDDFVRWLKKPYTPQW